MPYMKVQEDGRVCVYKKGADGEKVGKALGCHDTEDQADAQIAALYANEPEAERSKMNVFQRLAEMFRQWASELERPPEVAAPEERAVSIGQIFSQLDKALWDIDPAAAEAAGFPPGSYPWLNDLYVEDGQMTAILAAGGKLYRAPVMLEGTTATVGTVQEVEVQFAPVRMGAVRVVRQADGHYRWFAIAETAVLNRVGEIDSRAMFDEWVAQVEAGDRPALRFFHDSRLDFGTVDHLAREDAVLIASGLFDEESPLAQAFVDALAKGRGTWGTSVGFIPGVPPELWQVAEGVTVPVYTTGTLREISVLPEDCAASWFTGINAEVTRMQKKTLDALILLYGDEEAARAFAAEVDAKNRAIQDGGLITRAEDAASDEPPADEPEPQPDPEPTPEPDPEPEPQPREVVLDEEGAQAIADRVAAGFDARFEELRAAIEGLPQPPDLTPLQTALADVTKRLEALERSEDEKRAQWQADLPARPRIEVTYRPRQQPPPEPQEDPYPMKAKAESTLAKLPARN